MPISRLLPASFEQPNPTNFVINGDCSVSQRGTQTNQTTAYSACDRWEFIENGSSVVTTSQSTDVPSGSEFANSLKIDVTTASGTPSSGNYAILRTKFEGQDLQNLQYGTSSAKPLTLSFWVKSAKTGTHYAEAVHTDASYYTNSIVYTINSADTWEQKSITFSGYQTTGFDNDNANSFQLYFWLMTGSDYGGGTHTTNTWHNTTANRVVGQVNVMDSTSNDFYITGVCLNEGSHAIDFPHETYAETLNKCSRYYHRITYDSSSNRAFPSYNSSTTQIIANHTFPVPMRTRPTAIETNGTASDYDICHTNQSTNCSSVPTYNEATIFGTSIVATCSSVLTAGQGSQLRLKSSGAYLAWSAEL